MRSLIDLSATCSNLLAAAEGSTPSARNSSLASSISSGARWSNSSASVAIVRRRFPRRCLLIVGLLRVKRRLFRVRRNLQAQSSQSLEAIVYVAHRFSDSKRDEPRPRLVKLEYRIKHLSQLRCSLCRFHQLFNPLISVAFELKRVGDIEICWT